MKTLYVYDLDGSYVGKRRTPRPYTHAVIGSDANGARHVLSYSLSFDNAHKRMAHRELTWATLKTVVAVSLQKPPVSK